MRKGVSDPGPGDKDPAGIVVVGAGAMGSLVGAHLLRAGLDVTFLERRRDMVQAMERDGLELTLPDGVQWTLQPRVRSDPSSVESADWVFLCVKAGDTEAAAAQVADLVHRGAVLVSLQNGLGNFEAIQRACGPGSAILGTIAAGAYVEAPGRLKVAGLGPIHLGDPDDPDSDRLVRLARLLGSAGFEVLVERDIQQVIWDKLLVNVGINALTALLGLPNGALLAIESAARLMEAAVLEALAVGRASGLTLDAKEALARTRQVARTTAANRSSMLSDLLAGRRTEVAQINGAVADLAERLGLTAPVNRTLADLVESLSQALDADLLVSERRWHAPEGSDA